MAIFLLACKNADQSEESFELDGSSSLPVSSAAFANGTISTEI